MRERLGRDSENLSSLEIPVFMRVLRDLLRDEMFFTRTIIIVLTKAADIVYKKREFFPGWERFIPS